MHAVRSGRNTRRVPLWFVLSACIGLLTFVVAAKTIQYWPDVNAKLQISNSCKVEDRQDERTSCDLHELLAEPIIVIVVPETERWFLPIVSEPVRKHSFTPSIYYRPPPFQI